MAREKVKWCENCAMLAKMYLDSKAMHDTQVGDIRALREENARLKRELDGANIGMEIREKALEQAEAKLAKVVEALEKELNDTNGWSDVAIHRWRNVLRVCLAAAKWECPTCLGTGRMPDTQDVATGTIRQHFCKACGGSGVAAAKGE